MVDEVADRVRRLDIITEVVDERNRQDARFGEQNHTPFIYLSILTEEVGEAAKAANDSHVFASTKLLNTTVSTWDKDKLKAYRAELVQVAAVAVAMIECLDREKWAGGK